MHLSAVTQEKITPPTSILIFTFKDWGIYTLLQTVGMLTMERAPIRTVMGETLLYLMLKSASPHKRKTKKKSTTSTWMQALEVFMWFLPQTCVSYMIRLNILLREESAYRKVRYIQDLPEKKGK